MVFIKLKDWISESVDLHQAQGWILGNRVDDLGVKAVAQRATKLSLGSA